MSNEPIMGHAKVVHPVGEVERLRKKVEDLEAELKKPMSDPNYAVARLVDPAGHERACQNAVAFGLGQIMNAGRIMYDHWQYEKARAEALEQRLLNARKEFADELRRELKPDMDKVIDDRLSYLMGCELTKKEIEWARSTIRALQSFRDAIFARIIKDATSQK